MRLGAGELAILLIFGLPIMAVAGHFLVEGLKVMRGGSPRRDRQLEAEETRIIQDVYQGLRKLEERVEALETLLMDRAEKEPVRRRSD